MLTSKDKKSTKQALAPATGQRLNSIFSLSLQKAPHRTCPLCSTLAPVTQDRNTRQQHNFGFACRLPFRDLANDQLGDLGWVRSGGEKGVSFADSDPNTTSLHAHKRTGSLAQQTRTHYVLLHRRVCAKSLQSCLMLCDPMDRSLPGSSVRGISQARILEWVAMSSSRGSSPPRDRTCISHVSCLGRQALCCEHHLRCIET